MKGIRRDLKKSGPRAQCLIADIEKEVIDWVSSDESILDPDIQSSLNTPIEGTHVGRTCITQISRTPLQMVWNVADDPFTRYVVHCCARFHGIVSFSASHILIPEGTKCLTRLAGKDCSGRRLTYLLRPNVIHPNPQAVSSLQTPPLTDVDVSSNWNSEGEPLSDVSEEIILPDNYVSPSTNQVTVTDGVRTQTTMEPEENYMRVVETAMSSLSMGAYRTSVEGNSPMSFRARQARWSNGRIVRASSSPSRSPARRPTRRLPKDKDCATVEVKRTLYEYLYGR